MLSVPSHRLWPPVSLPRCHRHFSSSSTCFAHAWMVLRSDITWAGPLACLLVCLLALRQPLVQSCSPCAQRNLERYHPVKPARLCKHPWHTPFAHHSTHPSRNEHISAPGQRLHPPAPVRSTRTQHVGSRQHDAENCNRPASNESTPQ
jgi:hypothetical protein